MRLQANDTESAEGKFICDNELCRWVSEEGFKATKRFLNAVDRLKVLQSIYPRGFNWPDGWTKIEDNYDRPEFSILEFEYEALCVRLDKKYRESERTPAERKFKLKLESKTGKEVLRSIWIGSHCIDIFIPNLRSQENAPEKVMRGIAIEIDGDCHNLESKMQKDERKGVELQMIGIGVMHIQNWDFSEPLVENFTAKYGALRTLDSRERRRLWERIYAFTLAIHLSNNSFFDIFRLKH